MKRKGYTCNKRQQEKDKEFLIEVAYGQECHQLEAFCRNNTQGKGGPPGKGQWIKEFREQKDVANQPAACACKHQEVDDIALLSEVVKEHDRQRSTRRDQNIQRYFRMTRKEERDTQRVYTRNQVKDSLLKRDYLFQCYERAEEPTYHYSSVMRRDGEHRNIPAYPIQS